MPPRPSSARSSNFEPSLALPLDGDGLGIDVASTREGRWTWPLIGPPLVGALLNGVLTTEEYSSATGSLNKLGAFERVPTCTIAPTHFGQLCVWVRRPSPCVYQVRRQVS